MTSKTDAALLAIGNQTVLSMQTHGWRRLGIFNLPRDLWHISSTVKETVLTFEVLLRYDALLRAFMGEATDPIGWIAAVGLYAAVAIKSLKAEAALQRETWRVAGSERVVFVVTGHRNVNTTAWCTVSALEEVARAVEGVGYEDARIRTLEPLEFETRRTGER